MLEQMKKEMKMDKWMHIPQNCFKYKYYKMICREYKARVYVSSALLLWTVRWRKVSHHQAKAQIILLNWAWKGRQKRLIKQMFDLTNYCYAIIPRHPLLGMRGAHMHLIHSISWDTTVITVLNQTVSWQS
jgi:hypothetical protein